MAGLTFELREDEMVRVRKWRDEIDPPGDPGDKPKHGCIGGAFSYSFTPTSIGMITKVIFKPAKGEEQVLDLTDYDSW